MGVIFDERTLYSRKRFINSPKLFRFTDSIGCFVLCKVKRFAPTIFEARYWFLPCSPLHRHLPNRSILYFLFQKRGHGSINYQFLNRSSSLKFFVKAIANPYHDVFVKLQQTLELFLKWFLHRAFLFLLLQFPRSMQILFPV